MVLDDRIHRLNSLASFMTGDNDLWVTNCFERLHLMNVLAIQERLTELEERVNLYTRYNWCLDGNGGNIPEPEDSRELLANITTTIQEYSNAITSLAMIRNCSTPDLHVVQILNKEHSKISKSFGILRGSKDYASIAQRQISVGAKPRDWIHKYVARHERIARRFRVEDDNCKYTKFSEARLHKLEFGLVAICLCLVQLLPVLALTLVSSKVARLGIIIVLIILVSALNAVLSNTVRATNFGAIAAYSAVVVVLITQNN